MRSLVSLLVSLLVILSTSAQRIKYLNGLNEDSECTYRDDPLETGVCRRIADCAHVFNKFKANRSELKVCSYQKKDANTLICCPGTPIDAKQGDAQYKIDFAACRDEMLAYRKSKRDINDLIEAIREKNRVITDEDCANINLYGKGAIRCSNRKLSYAQTTVNGVLVEEGDWQNMAAIGWTQPSGEVDYHCGGTIINDRFIITAAHCDRHRGRKPDTVRLGDRFLLTSQDDNHAQQLAIESFTIHPSYRSSENYHDIALIKTRERIKFTKFIAPACILADDNEDLSLSTAGYGQTDIAENSSSTLHQIWVYTVPNTECNETYSNQSKLPRGIIASQLCVQGASSFNGMVQDTCLGDSGGAVRYNLKHEVNDIDYARTLIKTVYDIPAAVGIVSFGAGCALEIPFVNTRIAHYAEWLESTMNEG